MHFDVDCIDFTDAPLSENTGRNIGLAQDAAFAALAAVLLDSRVSALTITELNPDHGADDGSTLAAFVDRLVAALAGAPRCADAGRVARAARRGGSSAISEPGSGRQRSPRLARAAVGRLLADVHEALARMGEGADERGHAAADLAPGPHDLASRARQDGVDLAIDDDVASRRSHLTYVADDATCFRPPAYFGVRHA